MQGVPRPARFSLVFPADRPSSHVKKDKSKILFSPLAKSFTSCLFTQVSCKSTRCSPDIVPDSFQGHRHWRQLPLNIRLSTGLIFPH